MLSHIGKGQLPSGNRSLEVDGLQGELVSLWPGARVGRACLEIVSK